MYQQPRTLDNTASMFQQIRADPTDKVAQGLMSEIEAMEATMLDGEGPVSTGAASTRDRKLSVIEAARSIVAESMKR